MFGQRDDGAMSGSTARRPPSVVTRTRAVVLRGREQGWTTAARYVAQRLWAKGFAQQTLLVLAKDLSAIVTPARRGRVRVEAITADHLAALRELNRVHGDDAADARFAADLAAGIRGFVGFLDGHAVAHYWWTDDRADSPHYDIARFGLALTLGEAEAYGSNFYVDPAQRGGGTAADFLYQVEAALHDLGYRRLWGYVVADNAPARWLYAARGYEPRWQVRRRRVLGRWHSRTIPLN